MIKRLIVWALFAAAVYGVVLLVHAFKSPWSIASIAPVPPVVKLLPPASNGCGQDCRYD